jgi:hypothetical protein
MAEARRSHPRRQKSPRATSRKPMKNSEDADESGEQEHAGDDCEVSDVHDSSFGGAAGRSTRKDGSRLWSDYEGRGG